MVEDEEEGVQEGGKGERDLRRGSTHHHDAVRVPSLSVPTNRRWSFAMCAWRLQLCVASRRGASGCLPRRLHAPLRFLPICQYPMNVCHVRRYKHIGIASTRRMRLDEKKERKKLGNKL